MTFSLKHADHERLRRQLVQEYGTSHNYCAQFTRRFVQAFPALTRVCGFYYPPGSEWSQGEHWWLTDSDGAIVDPTADQFASQGAGRYVRYDPELHLVVKGRCMHCGVGLYSRAGTYPCSRGCAEALAQEYGCRVPDGPFEEEMDLRCDADLPRRYGIALPALTT